MKLHEIIANENEFTTSIEVQNFVPYKKSLLVYYNDMFCGNEPILMVTDVFNACQYGKIVSSGDFNDAIYAYLEVPYIETEESEEGFDEDLFAQYETICFNSIALSNL